MNKTMPQPSQQLRHHAGQRGFGMVSALLSLVIGAIILAGQLELQNLQTQQNAGSLQGELLANIKNAANNYALENYPALQSDLPVTKAGATLAFGSTFGQSMSPNITDLVNMGYLTTGYSATASLGIAGPGGVQPTYRILFTKEPAGCVAAACNVTGRLWIDQPIWQRGSTEIHGIQIGSLTRKLGADALVATNANPAQLVGPAGVTMPNPDAALRPGIVGARIGQGTSGFGAYLTINDPRDIRFFGNININGNLGVGTGTGPGGTSCNLVDVLNSGQVIARTSSCIRRAWMDGATGQVGVADAAGTTRALLDGSTGNISSMDAAGVVKAGMRYNLATGQSEVFGDNILNNAGTGGIRSDGTVFGTTGQFNNLVINSTATLGAACSPPNALVMGIVGGQPALLTCSGGSWTSTGGIASGTAGVFCPVNGALGVTSSGAQLMCVGNIWMGLADRMGRQATYEIYEVREGDSVPAPPCATGGLAKIVLAPQTIDASKLYTSYKADPVGGGWVIRVRDGSNASLAGVAIATTSCWYP